MWAEAAQSSCCPQNRVQKRLPGQEAVDIFKHITRFRNTKCFQHPAHLSRFSWQIFGRTTNFSSTSQNFQQRNHQDTCTVSNYFRWIFVFFPRTVALYKRFHEQWFPITTIWNYSCLKSIVISPRCPHNISPLTYFNNTLTRTPVSNFEWLFDLYCVNQK